VYLKNLFSLICGFLMPDSGFRFPITGSSSEIRIPVPGFSGCPNKTNVVATTTKHPDSRQSRYKSFVPLNQRSQNESSRQPRPQGPLLDDFQNGGSSGRSAILKIVEEKAWGRGWSSGRIPFSILVPIALFSSLSRQVLGTRIEGLWGHTIFLS